MMNKDCDVFDLCIVGGGVNGTGIARDAVGRGLTVLLCEAGDLGAAASSASSKLIHGGLRYLEQFEFDLVRASLREREVLLRIAPHLVRPLRFVLPHVPELRPWWQIRVGLFLYDHLARRVTLPASHGVDLCDSHLGAGLNPQFRRGFSYADCVVDDARLVVANARAAKDLGATISIHTACVALKAINGIWQVTLKDCITGESRKVKARALVNSAGPWVSEVRELIKGLAPGRRIRLVKGSHIVVPRVHDQSHAYILQNEDRRQTLVIPFQGKFSLIGTTEVPMEGRPPRSLSVADEEVAYLCRAAGRYLARPVRPEDVIWSYAGLRPLWDDNNVNPSAITRDFLLEVDLADGNTPALTVYGGKLTTYRHLADQALNKLKTFFPHMRPAWTHTAALPGGDIPNRDVAAFVDKLAIDYPGLPIRLLKDLVFRHGTLSTEILGNASDIKMMGQDFGAGLYDREVDYLIDREWIRTVNDVLWRRTKAGLHMTAEQRAGVESYLKRHSEKTKMLDA
ncbi:MAG: glycerol-3-phosphate dehydrogenase [Gammaproteobacteria bacterium]|nr:glycerol-3-phosphate dehydrogenase [Gammaproteobacteria bacterium]